LVKMLLSQAQRKRNDVSETRCADPDQAWAWLLINGNGPMAHVCLCCILRTAVWCACLFLVMFLFLYSLGIVHSAQLVVFRLRL
jgi:hypothetical protein